MFDPLDSHAFPTKKVEILPGSSLLMLCVLRVHMA